MPVNLEEAMPTVDLHHDTGPADAVRRGKMRARRSAIACLFPLLSACTAIDRLQESVRDAGSAGELVQDVAFAGLGYESFLPESADLIRLGIAYLMSDPLAPNWEIKTVRTRENVFRMQLTMKRRRTGGDGEAQYIFRRNARRLADAAGYDDYMLLRYEEGIESATSTARRFGAGEIRLIRAQEGRGIH
jgi:hypothetical protein